MSIHSFKFKGIQSSYPFARYLQTKQFFYNKKNPFKKIKVVGVVGTSGKTTTALYLYKFLKMMKKDVCYIGTHHIYYNEVEIQMDNTTPEACKLIQYLTSFKTLPSLIIMEVSSHAINEGRINFLRFHDLIFTNLGFDHLDYHWNQKNYFQVKKSIFISSNRLCRKYINVDDPFGQKIAKKCKHVIKIQKKDFNILQEIPSLSFNYYNLLSVYQYLRHHHYKKKVILSKLKEIKLENGRAERIQIHNFHFVIDYAHTPEEFEAILNDEIQNKIVVFGCGGNRDKEKRKKIGAIVNQYAKIRIVTEDNNRFEDIEEIKEDIVQKMDEYHFIKDRKEAIRYAIKIAKKSDTIYILGKGDENFLEKENKRIPHNDKEFIFSLFNHHESA